MALQVARKIAPYDKVLNSLILWVVKLYGHAAFDKLNNKIQHVGTPKGLNLENDPLHLTFWINGRTNQITENPMHFFKGTNGHVSDKFLNNTINIKPEKTVASS